MYNFLIFDENFLTFIHRKRPKVRKPFLAKNSKVAAQTNMP
jgi:hypothetical protein